MHHLALAPATPSTSALPGGRPAAAGRPGTLLGDPSSDRPPARPLADAGLADRVVARREGRPGDLVEFPTNGEPSPATLCSNLARSVVEILAGARPLDQIGRWVSDSVYVHLLRRTMLTVQARTTAADNALRPRMTIGDPLLAFPVDGVVEAVVMVHQPGRSRAVAIRLERHRTRWRATAINVL